MAVTASPPLVRVRPPRGWAALKLGELWEFREVVRVLALRDIQLRYKQTALGIVWVVLQPVAAALLFSAVFGRFAKLPSQGVSYGLFVLAGLVGWQLVAGILQRAGPSLVAETRLVTKVYFPRLLVPLASASAVLVDLAVTLGVYFVYAAIEQTWPGWSILWLPFWLSVAFALSSGLGFWLSALNVRYRDFMHVTPFLLQLWLFASPIVYSAELVPERWQLFFACNPMVGILTGLRSSLFNMPMTDFWPAVFSVGAASGALLSGLFYFRRVEQSFADRL